MMPRFSINETTICFRHGEADGWLLQIRWGRIVLEFTVAAFPRNPRPIHDPEDC